MEAAAVTAAAVVGLPSATVRVDDDVVFDPLAPVPASVVAVVGETFAVEAEEEAEVEEGRGGGAAVQPCALSSSRGTSHSRPPNIAEVSCCLERLQ